MQCAHLSNACLTLHAPSPACSSTCPRNRRPFRIDVRGPNASAEVRAALKAMQQLRDPLVSTRMRHLEYDLFDHPDVAASALPRRRARPDGSLVMLWPMWEGGFGDPYMWTVIPMGYALAQGELPNATIAISGALYPKLYDSQRVHL